ncbi:MAG: Tn3 family transposase, partial [Chloroflexi bacterium]|nr:Tn3 family transposase [Chloroflexota bacterium]
HEDRHKVARHVFHGRKGELRQPYREGIEDQLGALGLVVNVLILWTTLYMDRALTQVRAQGGTVNDEDVARLSPLGTNHINVPGPLPLLAAGDRRPR